eukprot:gene9463-2831_t
MGGGSHKAAGGWQAARGGGRASGGGGGGGMGVWAGWADADEPVLPPSALRKALALVEAARRESDRSKTLALPSILRRFFGSSPPRALAVSASRHLMRANKPQLLTH